MTLRRGFKTEANWYARELRRELGLRARAPLCPFALAEHLAIPVKPLSSYCDRLPGDVSFLRNGGGAEFSAVTVFAGTARLIVYNDGHHPLRSRSDLAHELAHGVLGHPPAPPLSTEGCRNFDPQLEDEANWLGPALLISEEAALWIARKKLTTAAASKLFEVSRPVIQMRLNVTGAKRRVAREGRLRPFPRR